MGSVIASFRLVVASMLVCVIAYTFFVLDFARNITPDSAQGSLLRNNEGKLIGSRLIAQGFTRPEHFWPRPSAVSYNASSSGGSNKSPTSADLTARAAETVAQHEAQANKHLPSDLAAASGSGLDPHITETAARFQVERIAKARGLSETAVDMLVRQHSFALGRFLVEDRLVNVLELNLALDRLRRGGR